MAREGTQDHESVWRHLDLGVWRLEIRATLRQLRCPEHGVHVEGVPFARYRARCTRDFDDLVAWLVTKADKTTICRLVRIDWQTIGRIIARVGEELIDGDRIANRRALEQILNEMRDLSHQAGEQILAGRGRPAARPRPPPATGRLNTAPNPGTGVST